MLMVALGWATGSMTNMPVLFERGSWKTQFGRTGGLQAPYYQAYGARNSKQISGPIFEKTIQVVESDCSNHADRKCNCEETLMKKLLLLKVIFAFFLIPSLAVAQGVCETVNRIVDSGINNRFAAVAGLYLPNSSECSANSNSYQCIWGDQESIDRFREMQSESLRILQEMRDDLRQQRQWLHRDDYLSLRDELDEMSRERRRNVDAARESFNSEAKRESGNLYQAMYRCFQTGAIADAPAYKLTNDSDDDENDWTWRKPTGCSLRITSDLDTRLQIRCP